MYRHYDPIPTSGGGGADDPPGGHPDGPPGGNPDGPPGGNPDDPSGEIPGKALITSGRAIPAPIHGNRSAIACRGGVASHNWAAAASFGGRFQAPDVSSLLSSVPSNIVMNLRLLNKYRRAASGNAILVGVTPPGTSLTDEAAGLVATLVNAATVSAVNDGVIPNFTATVAKLPDIVWQASNVPGPLTPSVWYKVASGGQCAAAPGMPTILPIRGTTGGDFYQPLGGSPEVRIEECEGVGNTARDQYVPKGTDRSKPHVLQVSTPNNPVPQWARDLSSIAVVGVVVEGDAPWDTLLLALFHYMAPKQSANQGMRLQAISVSPAVSPFTAAAQPGCTSV